MPQLDVYKRQTQINGGTIKGGKDGIRLADLGSSEVTLKLSLIHI